MISERITKIVREHLEQHPQDRNYVDLLLENNEFVPSDPTYCSWLKFNLQNVHRGENLIYRLEKFMGPLNGLKVLDIGSGGGGHSIAFSMHGCNVTAIEIDKTRLKWIKTRVSSWNLPIQILNKPLEILQLKEKYDLIICNDVIEHVDNWKLLIKNIIKISNGWTYLSFPNKFSLINMISDSHYGLFLGVFLNKNLQNKYLTFRGIKRKAWVTYIPSMREMRNLLRNTNIVSFEKILPQSYLKIAQPNSINNMRVRFLVKFLLKLKFPKKLIIQILSSQYKTIEVVFKTAKRF